MDVASIPLPFDDPSSFTEQQYLDAVCGLFESRVVAVPTNGSCFFDSIFALLPVVNKAVKSQKALRAEIVSFFRECHSSDLHGILGERIMDDINDALKSKIVSSCAKTRGNNRRPKDVDAYFDAVSKMSVWVEGLCTLGADISSIILPLYRLPLGQSCCSPVPSASDGGHLRMALCIRFWR
jgi:hypothetical protein